MNVQMEKIMTLHVRVAQPQRVGQTPEGILTIIPIIGGTFEGERLSGRVCPGGADWNVTVSDVLCHVLARYWIETDDGVVIAVENEGWLDLLHQDAALRTTPRFSCDLKGPYAWLTRGVYAGELRGEGENGVTIVVWKLG
ncbi:MAG TPA: DUF3237 domain-containing protein [Candidatus Limiplasma sp.]|nr:DUF3237 domain-containing protein [Candidatus Limiplasma sp.]